MLTTWSTGLPLPRSLLLWRLHKELWCFPHNSSKCGTSFFSMDSHQVNFSLHLLLFNSPSASIPLQLFFGLPLTALFPFLNMYFRTRLSFSLISKLYAVSLPRHGAPPRSQLSFLQSFFPSRSLLYFTQMNSLS